MERITKGMTLTLFRLQCLVRKELDASIASVDKKIPGWFQRLYDYSGEVFYTKDEAGKCWQVKHDGSVSCLVQSRDTLQIGDGWNKPEDLKPLNIKSPPDWNDYDKYLLNGGQLDYSEWKLQRQTGLT